MTHRRVGKLIGSLREGSKLHEPPIGLKAKGVVWIAAHPKDPPQLITAWGIKPLEFIKEPGPVMVTVSSHSIQANPPRADAHGYLTGWRRGGDETPKTGGRAKTGMSENG